MREEIKELKAFLSDKVYVCVVGLLLLGAYGFAIYHPGIGMDDTAVALYYDEGLAAYMGRWVLFLLNRVFQIPLEYYAPGVMDLLSVLILGLSATCWCVLWKKICEPKIQIPRWSYAIVAGVFVSSPIISELFVFYLHGGITIAYGVCAVALLFFLRSLALSKAPEATCEKAPEATPAKAAKRRQALNLIFSGISLCVLLGFYESFIVVYIIGAITLFFLLRLLYGKQEGACPYCVKFPAWLGRGAFTVAFAMALRAVILTALDWLYHFERLDVYQMNYYRFFGDIFTESGELQMLLKRFFMKYYMNALTYLPITVLVLVLAGFGISALYFSIRKKDWLLILCAIAVVILPVGMSIVEGAVTRYRSAQYVPLVCAFGVLLLFFALYRYGAALWVRSVATICLSILLINQVTDMNRWFYGDYLKYEDAKRVMVQVADDLASHYDTSKPLIFRGGYEVPEGIAKMSYTDEDTWQFQLMKTVTGWVDPHLMEKYIAKDGCSYVSAETLVISTLQWGVTAFDGTSKQLIRFWEMHGIEGFRCETDLQKISEAEDLRSELEMPAFPQDGYIVECEDYIIINLAN